VQGAYEDGHPPQRNSVGDKPVAQLGQYLLRQRRRPSAVDQPLGNRSDLVIGHCAELIISKPKLILRALSRYGERYRDRDVSVGATLPLRGTRSAGSSAICSSFVILAWRG
jgi:hypothetical protein